MSCTILLDVMYLSSHTKSTGSRIPHSRYTLSTTQGLDDRVVCDISTNTDLFVLKTCMRVIYAYSNRFLGLRTNWVSTACPGESQVQASTLALIFPCGGDRGNCFPGSTILDALSTGPVIHARLVCKCTIRLVCVKMVRVQNFRTNEQVFMTASQTIPPSGPRVVKSVY